MFPSLDEFFWAGKLLVQHWQSTWHTLHSFEAFSEAPFESSLETFFEILLEAPIGELNNKKSVELPVFSSKDQSSKATNSPSSL